MARRSTFPVLYDGVKTISVGDVKEWIKWIRADFPFLILQYQYQGHPIAYRVGVTSVPSNLGKGRIWYFLCPSTGKRCRKLYFIKGKFLHREAFKGCMYEIQTKSHQWRQLIPLLNVFFRAGKFDLKRKYFKKYYKGKPTKRFLWVITKAVKIHREKVHVAERFLHP